MKINVYIGYNRHTLDHLFRFKISYVNPDRAPLEQRDELFSLIKTYNEINLCTNSPYVLNYLSLCVKAFLVAKKLGHYPVELSNIIPESVSVNPYDLTIFQVNKDGSQDKLKFVDGLPSDDNLLNNELGKFNSLFDKLLEIEG